MPISGENSTGNAATTAPAPTTLFAPMVAMLAIKPTGLYGRA